MIHVSNLSKSFRDKRVLNNISFDVPGGSIVGLLGPSGAGKTTMIKILTGQLSYDGGSVRVFNEEGGADENAGTEARNLTGRDKLRFGILMDNFGLYERLSCVGNLKVFADIYGVPHSKIRPALQSVGLEEAYRCSAMNLSKGMKSRLQLARVFMHNPDIIFLDEPTSGLDPKSARAVCRIIEEKKKEGATIFLTTHNMEEAARLCDKVFFLNNGKIAEEGNPVEICRRYEAEGRIHIEPSYADILEAVFLDITGKEAREEI